MDSIAVLMGVLLGIVIVSMLIRASYRAVIYVLERYRHEAIVTEGQVALVYKNGRLLQTLAPGRYVFWGRQIFVQSIETRPQLMELPGQEVLTRDQMVVKVSAVLEFAVADAEKAMRSSVAYAGALYSSAQYALRSLIGERTLEEVLSQRASLDGALTPRVAPAAEALGLTVRAMVVKDFMLSGELKAAYAEVTKAGLESKAALERARGESAALRSLANAARGFETNPGLYQLRTLQALEQVLGASTGHTLMVGLNPEQAGFIRASKSPG